jgi:prepilin-type N-terminal cleavage/methylation domain-containing protein
MLITRVYSDQRGFTIAELLVATVVSLLVLGGAVSLTSQVQNGYRRQMEETAAEQEGRYALDWVSRLIRSAGNNPYNIATGNCPAANTAFSGLVPDPNGDTVQNDIRLQTDSNPPDRLLGGDTGACDQPNEDVTVSYDAGTRSITFLDNNLGGGATIRTDAVITSLQFIYRDGSHNVLAPPVNGAQVMYVETRLTVQPRAIANQGAGMTRTLSQEVRIKGRNF